jgi:hypothetical protein
MDNYFLNSKHKNCFVDMVIEDNMTLFDLERTCLFYIIAGNKDLYNKRRHIYNYDDHSIFDCFAEKTVDFSAGIGSLIKLGFNLYNGWSDKNTTPLALLGSLDKDNLNLATHALHIRFYHILFDDLVKL